MWIKVYKKKNVMASDDLESKIDYEIKYIQSYRIHEIPIEETESGKFNIVLDCGPNGGEGKPESYIYAQADNEKAILAKADSLITALEKGS